MRKLCLFRMTRKISAQTPERLYSALKPNDPLEKPVFALRLGIARAGLVSAGDVGRGIT